MSPSLVNVTKLGSREFLRVGRYVVPVDRIQGFDFDPPDYSGAEVMINIGDKVSRCFSGEIARALQDFFDVPKETHP